jgi:hypothetical protein
MPKLLPAAPPLCPNAVADYCAGTDGVGSCATTPLTPISKPIAAIARKFLRLNILPSLYSAATLPLLAGFGANSAA